MKVRWVNLLDEMHGNVDQRYYVRHIPGNGIEGAICNKPELSAATKKKKAAHPTCKSFSAYITASKAILHNPERRAAWQALYEADIRKARKYGKWVPGRLCDYVRREVSKALKEGREITP